MKLPPDWREFIELLNSNGVEYVVVGGHAVGYHGYPRYTGDIDFFVRASEANAAALARTLAGFGFAGASDLESVLTEPDKIIQLGRPPNRIDLLTSISGVSFDEAVRDGVTVSMDGVPVRMIGRRALLKNKRNTGRTKDRADAEEIEKTLPEDAE